MNINTEKKETHYYLIQLLEELKNLIEGISDSCYAENCSAIFTSSIGSHVRHILDHVRVFEFDLNQVVNYDSRIRNQSLEKNRKEAVLEIDRVMNLLKDFNISGDADVIIQAMPHDSQDLIEIRSTADREILFLISHTIHHNAIISAILKEQNIQPPENFGLAPSTIAYNRNPY